MYEIWLAIQIGWEILLDYLPWSIAGAALLLGLWVVAWMRPGVAWKRGFVPAIAVGFIATVTAASSIPRLTHASLSDMAYWIDWLMLFALAGLFGAIAVALAWPAAALFLRARG